MQKILVLVCVLLVRICIAEPIICHADTNTSFEKTYERYDSKEHEENDLSKIRQADSFYVDGFERVFLLDSYGRKINVSTKMGTSIIPLSSSALPSDFIIRGSKIFVYDEILEEIQIYSFVNTEVKRIPVTLPFGEYFKNLELHGMSIFIETHSGEYYYLNESLSKVYHYNAKNKPIELVDGFEFGEYWSSDVYGNTYSIQTDLYYDGVIDGSIVIVKHDRHKGDYFFYTLPDTVESLPLKFIQVNADGTAYVMYTEEDTVTIKEIIFEESLTLNEYAESSVVYKGSNYGKVNLDREQVLERANEMTYFEWNFTDKNSKVSEGVKLPRECCYYADLHKDEDCWEEFMVGIPYCWGGSSSVYNKTFQNQLSKGYVAGNSDSSGYYKAKTTGLDCSGYISIAYGLKEKQSTRTLIDYTKRLKSLSELKSMDMLVSPGDHVILFMNKVNDNSFLVNECCGRNGKTVTRIRTLNWFIIEGGYQARSAW